MKALLQNFLHLRANLVYSLCQAAIELFKHLKTFAKEILSGPDPTFCRIVEGSLEFKFSAYTFSELGRSCDSTIMSVPRVLPKTGVQRTIKYQR